MSNSLDDENDSMGSRHWRAKKHYLQLHINELSNTIKVLLESVDSNYDFINSQKEIIQQSLLIIKAKLYSALRSDSYLVCMQNAAIIRYHAEYLKTSYHTLNDTGLFNTSYVKVFRNEMEEFRELFIVWINDIKQMDREGIEDEWGLF